MKFVGFKDLIFEKILFTHDFAVVLLKPYV